MAVKPIPDGYHSITPYGSLRDCDKAIDFMVRAFGAKERYRMPGPDGKVAHCELQIGDSIIMMGEAHGEPKPMSLMLYVTDCDATFQRAVDAGAEVTEPVQDKFYGDRNGRLRDPFGNEWYVGTHVEDVSEEEMDRRWKTVQKQMQEAAE